MQAIPGESLNQNASLLTWKAQCMQNVEKDHTDQKLERIGKN